MGGRDLRTRWHQGSCRIAPLAIEKVSCKSCKHRLKPYYWCFEASWASISCPSLTLKLWEWLLELLAALQVITSLAQDILLPLAVCACRCVGQGRSGAMHSVWAAPLSLHHPFFLASSVLPTNLPRGMNAIREVETIWVHMDKDAQVHRPNWGKIHLNRN